MQRLHTCKMYVGQCPTFRGPVILTYLEDILMENVGLKILIECGIKFDPQIYM